MSRTHYALQERISLNDGMRSGPLAARYHEAFKACSDLWATLNNNSPLAFVILAEQIGETDDDPAGALKRLADQAEAMHNKISTVLTDTDRACAAERQRLKDCFEYAVHRQVELGKRRDVLAQLIERGGPVDVVQRRDKMRAASVPETELDRLAPLPDKGKMRAERAEIEAEIQKMGAFIRTYNESVLPAGFEEQALAFCRFLESVRTIKAGSVFDQAG